MTPREIIESLDCMVIGETAERLGTLIWFRDNQTGTTLGMYAHHVTRDEALFHVSVSRTSFYLENQSKQPQSGV